MNKFLELFGGPIALLSSITICIMLARRWKGDRAKSTRRHLAPVLYWGPVFLMACMALHVFQNGYNTITSVQAGKATFSFYHYSLQIFGAVLAYQSWLLLKQCRQHLGGTRRFNRKLYQSIALIVITTLPTVAFTPIGIVPTVVLGITFLVSLIVHRTAVKQKSQQPGRSAEPILQEAAMIPV
jgi:hypothetical protein